MVFRMVDDRITFRAEVAEGGQVPSGTNLGAVLGPARGLLTAERVALNFLQRLCGVATVTRAVRGRGGRHEERASATRARRPRSCGRCRSGRSQAGGGVPHRAGLDAGILIKDNHARSGGGGGRGDAAGARGVAGRAAGGGGGADGPDRGGARRAVPRCSCSTTSRPATVREAVALIGGRVPVEVSGRSDARDGARVRRSGSRLHRDRRPHPLRPRRRHLARDRAARERDDELREELRARGPRLARAHRAPRATLGSTSDRLKELARAGAPDWTVVLADEQTAGRGRQGRAWASPRGGLLPVRAAAPDLRERRPHPARRGRGRGGGARRFRRAAPAEVAERRAGGGAQARRDPRRGLARPRPASSGSWSASG